ncbi:hypothetical protein Tco_1419559 [Tanacetum coccineum]
MESVKKSIDERAKHKQEYNSWVNERQMQTTEDKVDSRNDAHADDADIRPRYEEEPMAEVQTTAKINIFATGQQHTEQPKFNNEGRWVPTGKIFTSSTTKVGRKPQNGLNDDITNQYECKQTLDVSASTLNIHAGTSLNPTKEGLQVWLLKRLISEKPGLQGFYMMHIAMTF